MNQRITKDILEKRVALVNDLLGNAQEPWQAERDSKGNLVPNPGCNYISGAYGGYRLEEMCKGGGCRDISPRLTKRELYDWINAYIDGIERGMK